jgi:hypothetical protein
VIGDDGLDGDLGELAANVIHGGPRLIDLRVRGFFAHVR